MGSSYDTHEDEDLEELLETLEGRLTGEDTSRLRSVYKDLSKEIHWGRWTELVLGRLFQEAETLFQGHDTLGQDVKCTKRDVWTMWSHEDGMLFSDEDPKAMARQHLIILWMVKKLLGALKTRTNQSIAEVPTLTEEEELELDALTSEFKGSGTHSRTEEEAVPVLSTDLEALRIQLISDGPCRSGPKHRRIQIRPQLRQGKQVLGYYCRDCRRVFKTVARTKDVVTSERTCFHPEAMWAEGKEGQEACCTVCKEVLPNPQTYKWSEVGLEPFGDDPKEDEVITLCSEY